MRAWGVKEVQEDIQTREGGEKRLELCCTGKSAVARCVRGEMGKDGLLKTYLFKKKKRYNNGTGEMRERVSPLPEHQILIPNKHVR